MSLLRSIESRIAQLVEGTFGKVFRTSVQPVEIARRLVKEMDDHQQRTMRKVYVPNVYEVFLSPDDHSQFAGTEVALATELGEYLAEHARRNGYSLLSRPRVQLLVEPELDLGAFGIATRMEGQPEDEAQPLDNNPSATMVYRPPAAPPPPAPPAASGTFVVSGPDGPYRLSGERVAIGRGKLNDLVVHDSSVSREHAELVRQPEGWLLRDLDSTNGVVVNGARVREQLLAAGDRITLGNVNLRFERDAGDDEVGP